MNRQTEVKNLASNVSSKAGLSEGAHSLLSKGAQGGTHLDAMISFITCFSATDYNDMSKHCDGNIDMQIQGSPTIKLNDMVSMFKNQIVPSFPDIHSKIIQSTYIENGLTICFEIEVCGTFTGVPFTPGFNLPPINKTNKLVSNIAELVVIKLNKNSNKICSAMLAAPDDGLPGGPLGLYVRAGGQLPSNLNLLHQGHTMMQQGAVGSQQQDILGTSNVKSSHEGHHEGAVAIVKQAYDCYFKHDLNGLMSLLSPDCVVQWGDEEALQKGVKSLPWFGVFTNPTQIKNAFVTMGSYYTLEKREHKQVIHMKNTVVYVNENTALFKANNQRCTYTTVEISQLDHAGKICKFTGWVDTKFIDLVYNQGLQQKQSSQGQVGQTQSADLLRGNVFGSSSSSSSNDNNQKLVQAVQVAYELFARGDIPTMLQKHCSPNVEWIWGDPQAAKDGHQSLPWCGKHDGTTELGAAFGEYAQVFETLSFIPVDIKAVNHNTVHGCVSIKMRNKRNGKEGQVLLLHIIQLDDNCKIVKFQDFQDTAYTQTML